MFLDEVRVLVIRTPNGRGQGVFWWEPAVTGGLARRGLFDSGYNALPAITVFGRWTRH
jgi:arabinogalactan endo-1,4-beta-galactosidase